MAEQDTTMTSINNSALREPSESQDIAYQPLEVFTLFANLPPELRLAIYQQAIEDIGPRVLTISQADSQTKNYILAIIPKQNGLHAKKVPTPLLHTCSESRALASKRYEYLHVAHYNRGTKHFAPEAFFDFSRDTIDSSPYHPTRYANDFWNLRHAAETLIHYIHYDAPVGQLGKFKYLRCAEARCMYIYWLEHSLFAHFTGLEYLTIVIGGFRSEDDWKACIEEAISRIKVRNPGWLSPKWELEYFGASERVSSVLEAL